MQSKDCPPVNEMLSEMLKLEQSIRHDMIKFENKMLQLIQRSSSANDHAIARLSKRLETMAEMIKITAGKVEFLTEKIS